MILFHVDAFASKAFTGNPAAICLLNEAPDAEWMQSMASELNLSETAFVWPEGNNFRLRWFTPKIEVPLCGHATLATAHVLYETRQCDNHKPIHFETLSGILECIKTSEGILMNFPAARVLDTSPQPAIYNALGLKVAPQFVGLAQKSNTLLIEVSGSDNVETLTPDHALLLKINSPNIIVTSKGNTHQPYDFVSRYFGIQQGIPEDPVTGSAHCILAPYWARKLNKNTFHAKQVSKRGGELKLNLLGDRVQIIGNAITLFRSEILTQL